MRRLTLDAIARVARIGRVASVARIERLRNPGWGYPRTQEPRIALRLIRVTRLNHAVASSPHERSDMRGSRAYNSNVWKVGQPIPHVAPAHAGYGCRNPCAIHE